MKLEELNKLITILKSLGLNNEEYYTYISQKGIINSFDVAISSGIWGCFILTNEGIINGLRFLVPKVINEETLLINIHELAHGYEIFPYIGTNYQENQEQSEEYARHIESLYLERKKSENHL